MGFDENRSIVPLDYDLQRGVTLVHGVLRLVL